MSNMIHKRPAPDRWLQIGHFNSWRILLGCTL